jgi:hypothetical protein
MRKSRAKKKALNKNLLIKVNVEINDKLASTRNLHTNYKYELMPDCRIAFLIVKIRKHLKLKAEEAVFLFIEGALAPLGNTIGSYCKKKLNCVLATENAFG